MIGMPLVLTDPPTQPIARDRSGQIARPWDFTAFAGAHTHLVVSRRPAAPAHRASSPWFMFGDGKTTPYRSRSETTHHEEHVELRLYGKDQDNIEFAVRIHHVEAWSATIPRAMSLKQERGMLHPKGHQNMLPVPSGFETLPRCFGNHIASTEANVLIREGWATGPVGSGSAVHGARERRRQEERQAHHER